MANSSTKDALHSVTKHNDISISGVSSNEVLRFDGTNWVNSLPSSSLVVTQSSHGFSVGDVLKSSGSNGAYAKAQANNAGNAEVLGIVTAVADTNTFTLTVSGYITTAAAVPNVTAGSALFLSASTAGALTATEPSTAGQISKPVAIVTTANAAMIIVAYRGETISTGANNWDVNGSELVLDADGDTSLTADTDDQIDIKISGADDFRFTANNLNVLSGSTLTIDSGATITNSGTANGFGGSRSVAGTTDNGIITFVNSGSTFAAESTLTFPFNISSHGNTNDLGTLTVTGAATFQTGNSWKTGQNPPFYFVNLDPNGADRSHVVRIRGGANASSSNVLEVQDYGGNTDFKVTGDGEVSVKEGTAMPSVTKGIAKAWINITATSGTATNQDSYNVSGFSDQGTGLYEITLDNDMNSANNYVVVCGGHDGVVADQRFQVGMTGVNLAAGVFRLIGAREVYDADRTSRNWATDPFARRTDMGPHGYCHRA